MRTCYVPLLMAVSNTTPFHSCEMPVWLTITDAAPLGEREWQIGQLKKYEGVALIIRIPGAVYAFMWDSINVYGGWQRAIIGHCHGKSIINGSWCHYASATNSMVRNTLDRADLQEVKRQGGQLMHNKSTRTFSGTRSPEAWMAACLMEISRSCSTCLSGYLLHIQHVHCCFEQI